MNGRHRLDPQPAAVSNAALRGASLAFAKPPVAPKPQANTYTGGPNGALLAATKVGTAHRGSATGSPAPLIKTWTGGSVRSDGRPNLSPLQAGSKASSSSTLGVPEDHPNREPSPSNIAARLAAARFSPMAPKPSVAGTPVMSERTMDERDVLPPAGSVGSVLARLESSHSSGPPKSTMAPISAAQASPPPLQSPKPQRLVKLSADFDHSNTNPKPVSRNQRTELPPAKYLDGNDDVEYLSKHRKDPIKSPPIKQKPVRLSAMRTGSPPPSKPLLPRTASHHVRLGSNDIGRSPSIRRVSTSHRSEQGPTSPASFKSAKEQQDEDERTKPSVPPPRRSNTRQAESMRPNSRPRPTAPLPITPRKQEASSPMRLPEKFSPPKRPASTRGISPGSVYHNPYQRGSVKQITQHMTGESLSSAIMGAALASSRNASPAPAHPLPMEPLFPSRKQQHHHHLPFHRSPSPQKQLPPKTTGKLRTTMRKDPSSSDDEDETNKYKKKGSRIMGIKGRKHPNKHHEGTRKRWRDQITERERKRYEGLWAANKGALMPNSSYWPDRATAEDDPSLDVLNLAVQEIWRRSRLPEHVLEEVWDLVDGRSIGRLRREEFVVGLWLVDQRLKGRKLPPKVSDSVWTSARSLGIKVKVRA